MSIENLKTMFARADAHDMREGLLAYERYNRVMSDLALKYDIPLERVVAAFVAMSPNNDYTGNLRSLVSALHGWRNDWSIDDVNVSTYRHCLVRAWDYLGGKNFMETAKGPKIRNFYMNILNPQSNLWVTVDGHMVATWRGLPLTMKEAICKGQREYDDIADGLKACAFELFMLPNQYQAVLWFTRKRVFKIKAWEQHDMLLPADDQWNTMRDIKTIAPYPARFPLLKGVKS